MAQNGVKGGSVAAPTGCDRAAAAGARIRMLMIGAALLVGIISLWRSGLCLPNDGLLDVASDAWLAPPSGSLLCEDDKVE